MSWLNSSFTQYAKSAISQAQASIDKALEIEPEQDPLAGAASKQIKSKAPPSRRSVTTTEEWTSWGASTVNNLWENSFTGVPSTNEQAAVPHKASNALKLGGQRKSRSPTKQLNRSPVEPKAHMPSKNLSNYTRTSKQTESLLPDKPGIIEKPEIYDPITDNAPSSKHPLKDMDVKSDPLNEIKADNSTSDVESKTSIDGDLKTFDKDKDLIPPSLSSCSSSSALSQSMLIKSTSSGSSQSTVTSIVTAVENSDHSGMDPATSPGALEKDKDKSGWCDEDDVDLDKTNSDHDSKESFELTEHKRCLSIGSTASSSILMLQSPYDTTESNGEKSDKSDDRSDEDSLRTPTNLLLSTSTSLNKPSELSQQIISEEKPIEQKKTAKPQRIITSPTHSEQSDLIILSEERESPGSQPSEILKLKEILHAREQRLFTMNKEYAQIHEDLQNERQRSHGLEQNLAVLSNKHSMVVEDLKEELSAVDNLKNHIEEELQTLKSIGDIEEMLNQIKEKDDLIEELTMEGEKLSQSSFNSSNNVKKLRQKEREDDKIIKDQKATIDSLSEQIESLKTDLKASQDFNRENEKSVFDLNSIINSQSEELYTLKGKVEDNEAEKSGLKTSLESCYKQISDLKQQTISAESRLSQESLSANLKTKEEAKDAILLLREESDNTIKQLKCQISELMEVIARLEQQAIWKEQRHRDQIQELHNRIEDADGRNQDLSLSITSSTQPLLRQIHLIQETQANQECNWERIESSLNDKLDDARSELTSVELEKRDTSDKLLIARNKISVLQTQLDSSRTSRSELEVELEVVQSKIQLLHTEKKKDSAKSAQIKAQYLKSLDESRAQCEELQQELEKTHSIVRELEHSKSVQDEDHDVLIASRSSTPPIEFTSQTHILERSLGFYGTSSPISPTMSISSNVHSSYAVEKIISQLKQSQSEILTYQEQVRGLSLSKASLSTEIAVVSQRCTELEQSCTELPNVRRENKELCTRYDTLLQMYGEKAEEVHELQLDLVDVREAYKAQIEQLLSKVIK